MKNMRLISAVGVLLGVFGLAACGGGGDPTSVRTVTTTGVITSFGSIYVNGVKFETDGATSSLDGLPGTGQNGLEVGMVVTIEGNVNSDGVTGTATHITFVDEVEGLVRSSNVAADGTGTLDVMGQAVTLDAATVFKSKVTAIASASQIAVGNIVEVSGYASGNGGIHATWVEVKSESMEQYRLHHREGIEVKGWIANLDAALQTFTLGADSTLVIEYGGAKLDLSGQPLRDGLYVEVKSVDGIAPDSGRLVASEVELKGGGNKHGGRAGDDVEIKGMVTSVKSATEFDLNGQPVLLTQRTRFKNGSAQEITAQVMLEVEGRVGADGVLIADEVEFEARAKVEIQAELDGVDAAANTIILLGKTIQVNNSTLIEDKVDGLRQMTQFMQNLRIGHRVKAHVYADAEGRLVAAKLKRERDGKTGVELEGPVDEVRADGTLVIAGITVDIGTHFPSFTALRGEELEIEGSFNGDVLVAIKIDHD